MSHDGLREAEEKMRAAGQAEEAIRAFRAGYQRLVGGERGLLPSGELEPLAGVRSLSELDEPPGEALAGVAVIKLNGGLATTMGLRHPKSLLEARDGNSFLDLIVRQVLALRRRYGVPVPLLLLNSEATRAETLAALGRHPDLPVGLPTDFLQSIEPKLDATNLRPVSWPADPALEWCPPGHGEVFGALRRSGILAELRDRGFELAMISNSDNLGATVEPRIAAHMKAERVPFLIEVVEGTEADRKGGHLARRRSDGQLVLRESVQTPPDDAASFRDFRRWRYYNTNSIWVDLGALADALEARDGVLDLPLIVNRKTVDPRDPASPVVLQLESAMGAAIETFSSSGALCVPRTRFAPVKTTDDLLLLRSDAYAVGDGFAIEPAAARRGALPFVELDPRFYGLLGDFERRFPSGPPSLIDAEHFVVQGDVTFGAGVVVRGSVELASPDPVRIGPETVLEG